MNQVNYTEIMNKRKKNLKPRDSLSYFKSNLKMIKENHSKHSIRKFQNKNSYFDVHRK